MVDVIYADEYLHEKGYLLYCEGDYTIGEQNSFELRIPPDLGIDQGSYLMIEGSEFGGLVDGIEIDTTEDFIIASGRTWHGLLASEVVKPNPGQSHLILSGDLNEVIGSVIERQKLGYCMTAASTKSGYAVSGYRVSRLASEMDAYSVIRSLCRSVGAKLKLSYDGALRKAVASAVARCEYVDDGIDGDQRDFVIKRTRPCNHLHCLGSGQGAARITLDLYANDQGVISKTQTLFGPKHKEQVYESPNSDAADLEEQGRKKLADLQSARFECSLVGVDDGRYDIDDIVGAKSTKHKVEVVTTVAKKIARINGDDISYETKTALEV